MNISENQKLYIYTHRHNFWGSGCTISSRPNFNAGLQQPRGKLEEILSKCLKRNCDLNDFCSIEITIDAISSNKDFTEKNGLRFRFD